MSLISAHTLGNARQLAAQSSRRLMEVLQDQSALTSEAFVAALSAALHYPVLDNRTLHALTPDFAVLPFAEAYRRECIPLRRDDGGLLIAMADPFATDVQAWLLDSVHEPFTLHLAHYADVSAFLSRHEETLKAMDRVLGDDMAPDAHPVLTDGIEHLSLSRISEDSSPVIRLVNSTLYDAMKIGASDIHLETTLTGLALKYRIDGVLDAVGQIQGVDMAEQIVSRIKVMAELDIAERRIPQDGRFKVHIQQREVDLRVSIMPSVYGEDAVLRILDRKSLTEQSRGLTLENVGLDPLTRQQFRALAREPYGMVLVTGPTGSGKTTTLYAAISEVNTGRDKIITIEDPVEYQLPGVLQIPVNEKKGLTFARGLRSILRHDPDKIMVGEIRDSETAQIAVQSALTGHLVLTTVHANNVFDVIGRFTNMNVDPYSFVSAINGIMAQRLVRIIFPHCGVDDMPDDELLAKSGVTADMLSSFHFRTGQGCGHCHGTGYKGRKAVAELLVFNDVIRELIVTREPVRKVKEAARANGTRTMREAALDMVRRGETTLQEINRVTSLV